MAKIPLSHHHKDARAILAKALGNYATLNESLAAKATTAKPQPGETEAQRARRAAVYQERATVAAALASQAQPIQTKE